MGIQAGDMSAARGHIELVLLSSRTEEMDKDVQFLRLTNRGTASGTSLTTGRFVEYDPRVWRIRHPRGSNHRCQGFRVCRPSL